MRRLLVAAGLVAGVCFLSLAFAGGTEKSKETSHESGASDLTTAVADLTKKVAALDKRIRQLEASQHTIVMSPSMMPGQKSIPKDWIQKDFNGMTYYIVPLGEK